MVLLYKEFSSDLKKAIFLKLGLRDGKDKHRMEIAIHLASGEDEKPLHKMFSRVLELEKEINLIVKEK